MVLKAGRTGQFDVIAGGAQVAARGGNWFTRRFGAGYPDLDEVLNLIEKRLSVDGRG